MPRAKKGKTEKKLSKHERVRTEEGWKRMKKREEEEKKKKKK